MQPLPSPHPSEDVGELGTITAIKITGLKILSQASLFLQNAYLVF